MWNRALLSVNVSNLSETVFDQRPNSMSAGEATRAVKNVVTKMGGRFSGSRNLCCISGFSPCTSMKELHNSPRAQIAAMMIHLSTMIVIIFSVMIDPDRSAAKISLDRQNETSSNVEYSTSR